MNRIIKIFLLSLVAVSLTITTTPALAATSTSTPLTEQVQSTPNLSQQDIQDKVDDTKSKLEDNVEDTLVSEAQSAVAETQKAISLRHGFATLPLNLATNVRQLKP